MFLHYNRNKVLSGEAGKEGGEPGTRNVSSLFEPHGNSVILLCCFILSSAFLLVCSKSSPIYPFNDWVDANSFFTMGKGMIHGKILYKDLFEQKGPLLYFMHAIAYLISNKTFLGVYILEAISFSFFLFYSQKILRLFISARSALYMLPFLSFIVLNTHSFMHGDSVEEFCLPLITASLYHLVQAFKNKPALSISNTVLLSNGLLAGCVLWLKFSLLGFWMGWIIAVIGCLIVARQYAAAVKASLIFLGGLLITTIPWIVYFGMNDAIGDWIGTYFLVNIKYYSNHLTFLYRLGAPIAFLMWDILNNPLVGLLSVIGLFIFIRSDIYLKQKPAKIAISTCGLLLFCGVYGGGRTYPYYFYIFTPFALLGISCLIDYAVLKLKKPMPRNRVAFIAAASIPVFIIASLLFNQNAYLLRQTKENLVQYKFAAVITQTKEATLLNYGFLDMGFYTVTGITPNVRYFQKQNLDYDKYPINMDEQNSYIKNKKTDYVILRKSTGSNSADTDVTNADMRIVNDNYNLIMVQQQQYEGNLYDYCLFKRSD